MTLTERIRSSGSNIGPVLSATAFAVTATLSAPSFPRQELHHVAPATSRGEEPTTRRNFFIRLGDSHIETAVPWVLDDEDSSQPFQRFAIDSHGAVLYGTQPGAVYNSINASIALQQASSFYLGVDETAKSEALWEIVLMAFTAKAPAPVIGQVDGSTTVDFLAPGRLLSVMIDEDFCYVSSFSSHKELKMTYALAEGGPRGELNDVIEGQLRDFHRAVNQAA